MATKPYFSYGTNFPASNRDLVTSTIKYENQTKRYFSSLDAEIYIGGERLLDINRIDFTYQENKMPMYGFNSFMPSRIFVGQKIIQGTFVIAFTKPGYIAELITKVDESTIAGDYDKVGISCDANNAALFKRSVDIMIGYGGYKNNENSYNSCFQTLEGVYITGFQQILDTSGEPVYEVYSFMARNLSFKGIEDIYKKGISENEYDSSKTQDTNETKQSEEIIENSKIAKALFSSQLNYIKSEENNRATIQIAFPQDSNDAVQEVRVTISNNKIGISKTYKLDAANNGWWVYHLKDGNEISKLNKELDKLNKSLDNCLLEIKFKDESNTNRTASQNVKMIRTV